MHDRIKVSGQGGSRRAPWTAVAGSNLAPATAQRAVRAGQTEQVAAAIAWATEVFRQALAVAPGAEVVPLAEPRVEGAGAARERAVRGVLPVWAALAAAVAGGGGNQS